MSLGKELSTELEYSARGTRELLSRIPAAKLDWKPHEKSMSLGRLGMHLAEVAGWIRTILNTGELDFARGGYRPVIPESTDQILETFERVYPEAIALLADTDDEHFDGSWTLRRGDHIFWSLTRAQAIRREFGHQYHHRGQLTVYLRLLDVPLPELFGPTADTLSMRGK